ncbi:MAG TPA: hypothetical protein VF556_17670 [Pyrinomonadaceae bacterium]|jgi:hypothetical protein
MKPGDDISIKATVLRVENNLLHAQTADGQLIQTSAANAEPEVKSVDLSEHKAILNSPENKSRRK